jgi:acetyl esterase/lipase
MRAGKLMKLIRPFLFIQKQLQRRATIPFVRRMSRRSERLFSVPAGVSRERISANGIDLEWLIPDGTDSENVIIYLHGGFVFPLYNPTRFLAGILAEKTGTRVLLVDFRIAPEFPFPAAIEDCAGAFRWLITEGNIAPEKVVLVGESAGGNLAITTSMYLRDAGDPLPGALVAISPVVDFTGGGTFYTQNDPMANAEFVMRQLDAYRGSADKRDPLLSPVYGNLQGLPSIMIQIGSEEILRSGVEEFTRIAEAAGVDVTLEIWPGMWHYWHIFYNALPEARGAMKSIGEFLMRH